MNVLIFFMSIMKLEIEIEDISYSLQCFGLKQKEVSGFQTNEAATKCLLHILNEKNETLDKIIYIATEDVLSKLHKINLLTTSKYFEETISEYCKNESLAQPSFESVKYTGKGSMSDIISKIIVQLNHADKVYIDTTGGFRDSVSIIQLLSRFLEYSGISHPISFYSDIVSKSVRDCSDTEELLLLLDGVNEFTSTGRSDILRTKCFKNDIYLEIRDLLDAMKMFTDAIQLCYTENLDKVLDKLLNSIEKAGKIESTESRIILLKQMLHIIKNKFFMSKQKVDYCSIVMWCVDNGLIQQALTIYIERIPEYVFNNRIVEYSKERYTLILEETRKNPSKSNIEAVLFYEDFLEYSEEKDKSKRKQLNDMVKYINQWHIKSDDKDVKKAFDSIYLFKSETENKNDYLKAAENAAIKYKNNHNIAVLAEYAKKYNHKTFQGTINSLKNNIPVVNGLLSIPTEKSNTFEKKINTVKNLLDISFEPDYKFNCEKEEIQSLLYDYIFVKSLRNRINHASGENKFSNSQAEYFEKLGYKPDSLSSEYISSLIKKSIEKLIQLTI